MAATTKSDKNQISQKALSREKKPQKRKSKYDEKIVVDATFEELMKELITPKKK